MKTKRVKASPIEAQSAPEAAPIAQEPAPAQDISRVAIPVDANGNVLWDMMREKTKDKLKSILADPSTAKVLNVESPVTSPVIEVFDPSWTGTIFDAVSKLEIVLAGKMYQIPQDIAEQAFTFTAAEKEKLGPPTARVINKYAPIWLEKFKDEIALAFLFITMTAVKLQMAVMLQKLRASQANGVETAKPAKATPPLHDNLERVEKESSVQ